MKKYNVAVLGATGAVGQEMMKILEERNFPIAELRPLASAPATARGSTRRWPSRPTYGCRSRSC